MRQKTLTVISVIVLAVALLTVLPSSEASAVATSQLVNLACKDFVPQIRSAASDVISARWSAAEPFPATQVPAATLFANDGFNPASAAECRRLGFATQVARIFSTGDPMVGKAISSKNAQAYADAVADAPSLERGLVRATAVIFQIRTGFAVVPGGTAQDLVRIQSCLNGQISTNQNNQVRGVSLDCSQEAIRRAVADTIAPGFYVGFRKNPAVNLSCANLKALAETGETVEARWAAGKAFVLDNECTPKTVKALSAVATNGGSQSPACQVGIVLFNEAEWVYSAWGTYSGTDIRLEDCFDQDYRWRDQTAIGVDVGDVAIDDDVWLMIIKTGDDLEFLTKGNAGDAWVSAGVDSKLGSHYAPGDYQVGIIAKSWGGSVDSLFEIDFFDIPELSTTAVAPAGKLITTWASIKD